MLDKKIKIGLLVPNLRSGGAERVISNTSKLLSKEGYEVYLFLFDDENISYDFSGKLISLKSKPGNNILSKAYNRLKRISKMIYFKWKLRIEITMSFLHSANIVNYYSFSKYRTLLSIRGYGDFVKNGKWYAKKSEKIDTLIVQTIRMKQEFEDLYNKSNNISVLNNPIDVNAIKNMISAEIDNEISDFLKTHKTICTVGSFKRDKGFWHLLKAFIKVKESVKNAGLIFIGHGGEMEKEIKMMAELSGYVDDILFLGYQSNPFKYVSKCEVYVCSSIYEGFPNALAESMACGIPVISTDCKTGPRELLNSDKVFGIQNEYIEAEYGILVPKLNEVINYNINYFEREEISMSNAISNVLGSVKKNEHYKDKSLERAEYFNENKYINNLNKILISRSYI